MEKFRKCWDKEKNDFIILNKNLSHGEMYQLLIERYPGTDITLQAMKNQRSRLKACKTTRNSYSTKTKPLYSEQIKKGYYRIKIAQPNEWISKAKWVYMATHPEEAFECYNDKYNHQYIFLDGDNTNFSPENIYKLPKRIAPLISHSTDGWSNDPEVNIIKIRQAELKMAALDIAERFGLCVKGSKGRLLKSTARERRRLYAATHTENKEKRRQRSKIYYERMKNNPEWKAKRKEYQKEWQRKKRAGLTTTQTY